MKIDEISIMITASADPKPYLVASPMTFWATRAPISSRPLRPLLTTHTRSKARSDSMTTMTITIMLIGRITGKITWKNVFTSLAPSTAAASRRLASTPFRPAR